MASNSGVVTGSDRVRTETPAEEMEAFDMLPPDARDALRNAKFNWPSGDFLKSLAAGRYTTRCLVDIIVNYERVH